MKPLLLPALCAVLLAGCHASATSDASPPIASPGASTPATPPSPPPANPGSIATTTATNASPTPSVNATAAAAPANTAPAVATAPAVLPKPTPSAPPDLPVPAQDVLRLSQTAVGESVVLAYIEGLKQPFSLNADQIIYLSDLGLTSPVISALVKKAGATDRAPVATPITNAPALPALPAEVAPPGPAPTAAPAAAPAALPVPGAPQPAPAAPVYGPAQPGAAAPPAPAGAAPVVVSAPPQAVTYTTFYDSLAPYGNWVRVEPYGWCWQPAVVSVTPTWQPYCDGGQWLWTDCGWYWQSTYTWGWAPFHYGRWHRSAGLGWVWAPGYDWGPAWVSWRYSSAYCGWAPLPPECHWSAGIGFSWVSGGAAVSIGFGIFDNSWYACSWNRFRDPGLHRWALDRPRLNQFVRDSKVAVGGDRSINIAGNNNTVIVNNGLPVDQVQRHSRDEVRKVAIQDASSPEAAQRAMRGAAAARPEVAAYRPRIEPAGDRGAAPSASVLGRQEARKAPGVTTTTTALPTRSSGSRSSMVPDAVSPVPGILGATAPAASRPANVPATTTPARTMERPRLGTTPAQGGTTARETPAAAAPTRPATSYPGANVGVPSRPEARPEALPSTPPSRRPGVAQPGVANPAPAPSPAPSRPSFDGSRTVPSRYPGASLGNNPSPATPGSAAIPSPSLPAAPAAPAAPPSRPMAPGPRTEAPAPNLPPQRMTPPAFAPRPEPRSFNPAPAPAPAPMPGAAPRGFAPTPTAPPPRTFSPAPAPAAPAAPGPRHMPAQRVESPRSSQGRGSPAER